jgi:multidrug efflux pump subunit AcrA (membrane-fusion protein)
MSTPSVNPAPASPYPPLRRDLIVTSSESKEGPVFLLRDPVSGEVFEFGREEWFLLQSLDGKSTPEDMMSAFYKEFRIVLSIEQLEDFIGMVSGWGLLQYPIGGSEELTGDSLEEEDVVENGMNVDDGDWLSLDGEQMLGPGWALQTPPVEQEAVVDDGSEEIIIPAHKPEQKKSQLFWTWFDSTNLFRFLSQLLSPFRFLAYLLPPLVLVAALTIFNNINIFVEDFEKIKAPLNLFQHLLFGMFTVDLVDSIGSGIIASGAGARVNGYGIKMFFGLIPRFAHNKEGIEELDRHQKLWVYAGSLMIRLGLCSLSAILWQMTRPSGTDLYAFFLILTVVSFTTFVIYANPLMKGCGGYGLLTTILEMPNLLQEARRALFGKFSKRRPADGNDEERRLALRAYGLASLIFLVGIGGLALIFIGQWLEFNYQGTGVAIFLVLLLYLIFYFRRRVLARRKAMLANRDASMRGGMGMGMGMRGGRGMGMRGGMGMGMGMRGGTGMGMRGGMGMQDDMDMGVLDDMDMDMDKDMDLEMHGGRGMGMQGSRGARMQAMLQNRHGPMVNERMRRRLQQSELVAPLQENEGKGPRKYIVTGIFLAFIPVLFLPYDYETGGPFQVLPNQRAQITAEIPGVVEEVYYNGGEWLPEGTAIAQLSSLDQQNDIDTTKAQLLEAKAKLQDLLTTPTPEDINLAKQQLETARTQAKFDTENAQRKEKLYKSGSVSLEDYQQALKQAQVDQAQVLVAKANLDKVMAGPNPSEIDGARHEVERLQAQLSYYEEQLKLTRLVMPRDGRIVTTDLKLNIGKYLNKGDLFASVEDDRVVQVEVQVPESDISEVDTGARTRLKIWTYPNKIFEGKVSEVAPSVASQSTGNFVPVTAIIPNDQRLIKSGMTGFGKVDGGTKPVIVAFTRMLVRFFLIEMWSWIP